MSGFFALDQYANFIWAAYGASVLGIAVAIVLCVQAYARAKKRLANLEKDSA
jgi:heme exporter protein CcmD